MKVITSAQNPLVKHLAKLGKDSLYRKSCQSLLLEGQKIILEAQKKHLLKAFCIPIEQTNQYPQAQPLKSSVAQKVTTLKTTDGFFAEMKRPENKKLSTFDKLLVFDRIQDPGNMGTLIRSALAFGFDGIFILDGSTDPFSPKVLRASMGACLNIPVQQGTYEELNTLILENNAQLLIADAAGSPLKTHTLNNPVALVLGSESNGPSWSHYSDFECISIAIDNVDSLNVGVAGSILMHKIKEQKL